MVVHFNLSAVDGFMQTMTNQKNDVEEEKDDVLEDEVLEEEEEKDDVLEEEEEIQCDNCNETIVFSKNGVFILSRIRQLLERAEAEGAGCKRSEKRGNSVGGSRRSSSSNPYNVEDSSLSKYDELCWCQNCFEHNWKIMRDDLWECDDFEQFEDDEGSGAVRRR